MYVLQIDNPVIEKLAKEVFQKQSVSDSVEFYQFLQNQKHKQDVEQSIQEMENASCVSIDLAFEQSYEELGL